MSGMGRTADVGGASGMWTEREKFLEEQKVN